MPRIGYVTSVIRSGNVDAFEQGLRELGYVIGQNVMIAARDQRAQRLVLLSSPSVFANLKRLADLARQYRVPAISVFPQFADAGGLIGYGPNTPDLRRRAAGYVDRILKGTKPADLPIQRPVVFELAVNLKTANVLGLTSWPARTRSSSDSHIASCRALFAEFAAKNRVPAITAWRRDVAMQAHCGPTVLAGMVSVWHA